MARLSEVASSPWRPLSEREAESVRAISAKLLSALDFVTDWRLQKAYFIAEVWSIEERLHRLSAADFASWTHGPWSLHVREATEALESMGVVKRETQPARRRREAEFLMVASPGRIPSLERGTVGFLDDVTDQLRFLDGEALTRVAKAAPPYASAKRQDRIGLDAYLESLKKKHAKLVTSSKVAAMVAEAKAED